MSFPGWVPCWFMRLLDLIFGGESVPALRCECGRMMLMDDIQADASPQEVSKIMEARIDAHNRFFHPERLTDSQ